MKFSLVPQLFKIQDLSLPFSVFQDLHQLFHLTSLLGIPLKNNQFGPVTLMPEIQVYHFTSVISENLQSHIFVASKMLWKWPPVKFGHILAWKKLFVF